MIPINETSSPPPVSAISETFIAPSKKSQQEILSALLALDTDSSAKQRLSVRLSGKQFIIARKRLIPNPFARSIFGVVNEASTGSIIDYSFSVNPAVRIIFSLWFGMMTAVLIAGLGAIMTSGITQWRLELVGLAVVFLAVALGVVALCLLASRKGEKGLEAKLHSIIGDTTMNIAVSDEVASPKVIESIKIS